MSVDPGPALVLEDPVPLDEVAAEPSRPVAPIQVEIPDPVAEPSTAIVTPLQEDGDAAGMRLCIGLGLMLAVYLIRRGWPAMPQSVLRVWVPVSAAAGGLGLALVSGQSVTVGLTEGFTQALVAMGMWSMVGKGLPKVPKPGGVVGALVSVLSEPVAVPESAKPVEPVVGDPVVVLPAEPSKPVSGDSGPTGGHAGG